MSEVITETVPEMPDELQRLYRDHFHALALLSLHYPSYLAYSDPGRPEVPVLTLSTPHGQMAYYVPGADRDRDLWLHVRWGDDRQAHAAYDGHTAEERHARIRTRVGSFPTVS